MTNTSDDNVARAQRLLLEVTANLQHVRGGFLHVEVATASQAQVCSTLGMPELATFWTAVTNLSMAVRQQHDAAAEVI